jgi:hypothetical protein
MKKMPNNEFIIGSTSEKALSGITNTSQNR